MADTISAARAQAPLTRGDRRTARKRIILLLDGTWNDEDFGDTDTNIVRLQEIIAKTLERELDADPDIAHPIKDKHNVDNFVFYQRGVGTSWRDRWSATLRPPAC